ncbi:dehydrodolichyl diphosphate synthase [Lineolata rhizophorae]|uniref:Alkyl transferase n=1 Tax=Lineolata rhizophorae TaxID=578093 RepID=A0A6A6P8G3_9PEZI|nr:dehydrodolichyl diphosphate synthase [Lineolata rhizophorae]
MSLHLSNATNWFLQSPPLEFAISHLRNLLIGALRKGPIPEHIAFVMDGNRRFARNHHIETVEGHNLGFEALARILEVCYKSGVRVVTIYAFSIENFKRSKYEVDALMDMAKVKLQQLTQHGDLLHQYGACIRILGQRELIKQDVLEAVNRAVDLTKANKRAVLNVCFPYTSREEITAAIRGTVMEYSTPLSPPSQSEAARAKRTFSESHIARHIRAQQHLGTVAEENGNGANRSRSSSPVPPGTIEDSSADGEEYEGEKKAKQEHRHQQAPSSTSSDPSTASPSTHPTSAPSPPATSSPPQFLDPETITADTISSHLYSPTDPPLDMLVRTSGVERLSDFMLWQCHEHTKVVFLECLWPEFDLWHFLPVLVEWQWERRKADEVEGLRNGRKRLGWGRGW